MTIETIKRKEWCAGCRAEVGEHSALRKGERLEYGGFELAPGMVPLAKRTFGPSPTPRGLPRVTTKRLVVRRLGPITVHCLRCNAARIVLVGPDTVLASPR